MEESDIIKAIKIKEPGNEQEESLLLNQSLQMTKGNEISIYNESWVFEKKSSIMKVSNNSKNYFESLY